ncbi:MAG: thiamine-phosphate pyrophosphorylase [Crocinitomix sp.]|jgi:thiamine-phosphate pyrophosphorylase
MNISSLQYITNGKTENEILDEVNSVLNAGVNWVQLRIKNTELDVLTIAKKVKALCENKSTFILNDHVEIVKSINADGVHLGLGDMSIEAARKILGPSKIIGGTANTKGDCLKRIKYGADYIGLGPFRHTTTKKKLSPILGITGYQSMLNEEITIPVVAIGGIRLADLVDLKNETEVHGVAVSSLIGLSNNKDVLIKSIREIWKGEHMYVPLSK